jgi:hypothetical protein
MSFPHWNIPPSKWGPYAWTFLHMVTFCYPQESTLTDQTRVRNFVDALARVLPCKKCREHFTALIASDPVDLRSRDHLIEWGIRVHNKVNERLGKPILSHEDVVQLLQSDPNRFQDGMILGAGTALALMALLYWAIK